MPFQTDHHKGMGGDAPKPKEPRKPCTIRVIVRDKETVHETPEPIHDRTGDHNDSYFRNWITDTEWWALRNGKTVVKYPL